MTSNTTQTLLWVACSVLAALVLTVIPLPAWLGPARPAWAVLVLIYWQLNYPRRVGFLLSWGVGLLLDGLTGSLLGEHALALIIVSFCILKLASLIRTFPLWQQSLTLLPILAIYAFTLFWIDGAVGRSAPTLWRWLPVLTSTLLWPLLAYTLDSLTGRTSDS